MSVPTAFQPLKSDRYYRAASTSAPHRLRHAVTDGGYDRTLADIRRALEDAGIVFIDENGGGPGVRLKNRSGE